MVQIVEENMAESGCYCLRSKPNSTGYINKNKWLVERFNESLKYVKIMRITSQQGLLNMRQLKIVHVQSMGGIISLFTAYG